LENVKADYAISQGVLAERQRRCFVSVGEGIDSTSDDPEVLLPIYGRPGLVTGS
jgi:hypothetical protein